VLGGDEELEIFLLGLLADDGGEIVEHVFEAEVDFFDVELAGFDLGEVEDVVDDAEEGLGG
jgi:hypothetical protein